MATLFTIDLEEGNLTDFDSTTGTGLSAIAPGLIASVWCMAVANADANARYGQIAAASDKDHVRLFFSLDPLTIDPLVMANNDIFTVLLCQDNSSNDAFRVELGYTTAAGFRVRPGIYTDGAAWSDGAWVAISTNEHFIEVEWKASSGAGADNGLIKMWVDVYGDVNGNLGDPFSSPDSSITGIDNDTRAARIFRLGAPVGLDAGTSGTLWVDHLVVNDNGAEIGHPGVLAFADAEGAGRFSVGGREGTVYIVSNTNNTGAGSFRAACEASGARIVVFTTDGTIQLTSNVSITDPYISIFGQTAPGDGICLRDYTLRVRTHDVIIQHIRSRAGDTSGATADDLDAISITNNPSSNTDSDNMVFNVILDHCSLSWSIDEIIEVWNSAPGNSWMKNITLQWCIFAEALDDAGHSEGTHSMGPLFGSSGAMGGKNASVHHCLFVHNNKRAPRFEQWTEFEVFNCVMHDCPGFVFVANNSDSNFNFAGCTIGSQSADYTVLVEWLGSAVVADYYDHQVYVADNVGNYYVDDAWQVVGKGWGSGQGASGDFRTAWESSTLIHVANSQLTAESRTVAYTSALSGAGCFPRDTADARIVQDIEDSNTGLIDSQTEVGSWPTLTGGTPGTDTDSDGMPDDWEDEYGLDKNEADDDQYDLSIFWTNIEVYANPPDIIPLPPIPVVGIITEVGTGYKLRFYSPAGILVAETSDFWHLSYAKRVNYPGLLTFNMSGDHAAVVLLENRSQVEVWRRNQRQGIPWYCDFRALYLSQERQYTDRNIFTAYCPGQMWLLSTRIIAWYADTANRSKFTSVPAETIMKTLVQYNAAGSATTGNGRLRAGWIPGLGYDPDEARGNTLSWNCAYKSLLTELQDLALVGGGDFDLVKVAAEAWTFRWYTGQRGLDRSSTVIFALDRGNMSNPHYRYSRIAEKTIGIVGGAGEKSGRDIEIVSGADFDNQDNNIEVFVDARSIKTAAGQQAAGNKRLNELQARDVFDFNVEQTASCLYGADYELGDLVTARAFGVEGTYKFVAAIVTLNEDGSDQVDIETEAQ